MNALCRMLLVFRVDDRRYALRLPTTLRVLPMMHVEPLPGAPAVVAGMIDVAGRIIPVMNLRLRLRLTEREALLSDVLILARSKELTVALPADSVVGVIDAGEIEVTPTAAIAPGVEHVSGVAKLDDGLVLIQDLDLFLFRDERRTLGQVLSRTEVRS